jgi:hypothetical protein
MQILNGYSNASLSRSRLASINAALLRVSNTASHVANYDSGSSPFIEPESPTVDTNGRRISYMDVDPGDYLDVAQPTIPDIPHPMSATSMNPPQSHPHTPVMHQQQQPDTPTENFNNHPKPPANPLNWCYPSYFDAAPQFEESQYYERPSFGQVMSKPLHKIGNRLNTSRQHSPHASHMRSSSQMNMERNMGTEFALQNPVAAMGMRHLPQQQQHHHQQPQVQAQQPQIQSQQPQHPQFHAMSHAPPQQQFRSTAPMHDQVQHMYTSQG